MTGSPAPTTGTVTGLTNGVTYTFTVTASNPAGAGPPSPASNAATPSATASAVINGGFDTNLSAWTRSGVPLPSRSTARAHSGAASALLGTVQPAAQPNGDSTLRQTVTVPTGASQLSFWYWPATADDECVGAGCVYDWQEAQIRTVSGTTIASVFKGASNDQAWTQVTYNTTQLAGQTVVLWFNVHQDGASPPDDTWMFLDDVSLVTTGPAVAPGAPSGVTATAGHGSANVTWTAPGNGGSPITSYIITPFIGTTAQPSTIVSGSPPATSATVLGLTPGAAHTFRVAATNAVGTGGSSPPSNAVTPTALTVPGTPTNVTATAGIGTATVAWSVPANGGSPITSYTVTPSLSGEGGTPLPPVTVTGSPPAASTVVSGLTNGATYTFTVGAANAIGPSSSSAPSIPLTLPAPPAAPTGVTATVASESSTVSWTAPANGGSAITGYTVTPYIGTTAQPATVITGNPPATSKVITGLANGTTYSFKITATNAVGTGPPSAASNLVTPTSASVPAGPTSVSASVAGTTSALVSWTAPADGGSAITSYTITPYIGITAQTPTVITGNPPATSTVITGLATGTTYLFLVAATNAVGSGPASSPSNPVTPAPPVVCPCTLFGTATPAAADSGDSSAVQLGVKFTADINGFISGIRFYKSAANTGTHTGTLWTSTGTLLATVTFTGETATGWQQALFSAPVPVTAGTTYIAAYHAPNGHYAATNNGFGTSLDNPPLRAPATGVTPNGLYLYSSTPAFPTDSFQGSNYWVDVTFTTAPTAPAAPTAPSATAGSGSATVSWTAPANGGSPITGYTVTPYIGITAQTPTTITGNPPATSTVITGLTNGTPYLFTVTATNAVGTGPASSPSNPVTPTNSTTAPGTPTAVTATPGSGSRQCHGRRRPTVDRPSPATRSRPTSAPPPRPPPPSPEARRPPPR